MYSERARHTGNFNPRFLAGATSAGSGGGDIAEFQSTLPYGSDEHLREPLGRRYYFNPRSLTGATTARYILKKTTGISIHAPLRERPAATYLGQFLFGISIHAPLRERLTQSLLVPCRVKFQSTLPYGSDKSQLKQNLPGSISIHAPLRERHNLLRVSLI